MSKEIYRKGVPTNTHDRDEQATIGGYREGPPLKIAVIKLDRHVEKPNQQPKK